MLSVIIPAYNEEAMIPITAKCVAGLLEKEKIVYELVFVNGFGRQPTCEGYLFFQEFWKRVSDDGRACLRERCGMCHHRL